tara:strand:- start:1368 stop:1529 length:162 start_codon:yes stop_codon:yes gene_type:complete
MKVNIIIASNININTIIAAPTIKLIDVASNISILLKIIINPDAKNSTYKAIKL